MIDNDNSYHNDNMKLTNVYLKLRYTYKKSVTLLNIVSSLVPTKNMAVTL